MEKYFDCGGVIDFTKFEKISGIYFLCKDGECIYVGMSIDIKSRIRTHTNHFRMNKDFDYAFYLHFNQEEVSLRGCEAYFIELLQPVKNQGRGGKIWNPGKRNITEDDKKACGEALRKMTIATIKDVWSNDCNGYMLINKKFVKTDKNQLSLLLK